MRTVQMTLDDDFATTVDRVASRLRTTRFAFTRDAYILKNILTLMTALFLVWTVSSSAAEVQKAEMAGYLLVSTEKVPDSYNAGFSLYAAAWPLLEHYPGHRFQTGLFGTWMHAQYEGKPPTNLYSDIEGGLGWWRDTRFPTETPKFIMGGVAVNFKEIANGPSHGRGTWDKPQGLYGVAQLSPWLLFPIDGLNLKQGTCGELFGYGYLPLPLTAAKATTGGKPVPTGDTCWTLFLNTKNFKGPVCFFTPYFWSHSAEVNTNYAGLLLDARPSAPNKPFQMETQYVPATLAVDEKGETFARVAPTSFPVGPDGNTVVLHRLTSYNKEALWDGVKAWFAGGPAVSGAVNPDGAYVQTFRANGGSTWKIYAERTPKEKKVALAWSSFSTPISSSPTTYGYTWNREFVKQVAAPNGARVILPEYFRLQSDGKKEKWSVAKSTEIPAASGLAELRFDRPKEKAPEPYDTPEAPESSFKRPGPVAGPFKARLGDGSVVTYSWYRFADQPALLNADLTKEDRERMQAKVEKLHRAWTKDRDYLAPPTVGTLADLDPAQLVTPPKGFEIGYVPIATRQEQDASARGNAFSRIKMRLTEGRSATLLIISDSTGYREESGTRRFVRWLATTFPTHRTSELLWDEWTSKGATGPRQYGAPRVIAEGTTGATLTVLNAVLPGAVAQAMIDGTRWEAMTAPLSGNAPDLILWNHGHNHQANLPPSNFATGRGSFLAPIGRIDLAFPDTPQAAIIQNPWRDSDGYQRVFDWWKSVEEVTPSLTMVDGYSPYIDQSRNPQLYQDNVHPSGKGYDLIFRQLVAAWEQTLAKEVAPAPGWVTARGTSLIENGDLSDWTGDVPAHWRIVGGATVKKDTEHTFAKATRSLALTGRKQNDGVEVLLSKAALAQSLGKTLSIAVLCYVPAAAEQDMQVKFTTSASDQVTGSTQYARDNWKWIVLAGCNVPKDAKYASIGMYRSFAKAPNDTPFYIQKLVVVAGDAPAGAMADRQ